MGTQVNLAVSHFHNYVKTSGTELLLNIEAYDRSVSSDLINTILSGKVLLNKKQCMH